MSTTASDESVPDNPVQAVLAQNERLATLAYNRSFEYRTKICDAVNNRYGITVTPTEAQAAVLDANRFGLLQQWANTDA